MTEIVRFSNLPRIFARAERLFQRVAKDLQARLPAAEILHVGGTALPGSWTKGDLDVAVRVAAADFAAVEAVLAALFERNNGSVRTPEFAAFHDSRSDPPLGLQLVVVDSEYDDFHRWLRLLERNDELRRRYEDLKLRFQGRPMDEYRSAKAEFIQAGLGRG